MSELLRDEIDSLRAERDALLARLEEAEKERDQLKAARRISELDNHHNALLCPYCNGPIKDEIARLQADNETFRAADYSALTSDADKLRDRMIEVVEQKRDEWAESAAMAYPHTPSTDYLTYSSYEAAANEIITALKAVDMGGAVEGKRHETM